MVTLAALNARDAALKEESQRHADDLNQRLQTLEIGAHAIDEKLAELLALEKAKK